MKRSITLAFLLACGGWAMTIEQINDKPASRAKNFLIWQYLQQDINASQASEAFYQIDTVNERFLLDYAKKTDEPEIRYIADCINKLSSELMDIEQDDCLYVALTPAKAQLLRSDERERLSARLDGKFGDVEWLHTMNQGNHFLPDSEVEDSLRLFLISTPSYRHENFNRIIDIRTLEEIAGLKRFGSFVYAAVTDPKLDQLQKSLAQISNGNFDYQTHFYLGVNALHFLQNENAVFHLKSALALGRTRMDIDKSTFWLYRLTQDQKYLDQLGQSLDINMYSLWGKERLGITAENYFTTLPTTPVSGFKGEDPFQWQSLYNEIRSTTPETLYSLLQNYESNDSLPIQAFMLERTYTPYIHNFTMAYDQYMGSLTNDQKAMLYALMRQETQFIPGLISRSFALGLMQIMPFNVDSISKSHTLKITNYDDMFKPEFNIPYAIEHMKHIDNTLYNPVLKAYAYNGGIGFTRRMLLSPEMFANGEHEPFMSMELIGNAESREYGKKVLSNYVIYKKILGEPVSISAIFDNLTQPSQSDYFRAEALKTVQP